MKVLILLESERIRKEIESLWKKCSSLDKEKENCIKTIRKLRLELQKAERRENPDLYWTCKQCGKSFKKTLWMLKHPESIPELCLECRKKDELAKKTKEFKDLLLGSVVIDLEVNDEDKDYLYNIILKTKEGQIVEVYADIDTDRDVMGLKVGITI